MTEGSDRVALPIRVHDFLMACAGRVDDDALTDARELLAVAELDRSVDLLVVSLVAGRVPLTTAERDQLRVLIGAVRGEPALVDRIVVDDADAVRRHRFAAGTDADPSPYEGVRDAIGSLVDVLPDIGSVSCVWRCTPAGAVTGPVPQRVVLIETGPNGFAASTAYRVEQALRRARIRAVVEVLRTGAELTDYHRDALAAARRSAVSAVVQPAPVVVPVQPVASTAPAQPTAAASAEPAVSEAPAPRSVTSTRRRTAQHAERRTASGESAAVQWLARVASGATQPDQAAPQPTAAPVPVAQPAAANNPLTNGRLTGLSRPTNGHHAGPANGLSAVQRAPEPPRQPTAAAAPALAASAAANAQLSGREQDLLRQLHEELAKREQAGAVVPMAKWQSDPASSNNGGHPTPDYGDGMAWRSGPEQTAVNGIPVYGGHPPERTGF